LASKKAGLGKEASAQVDASQTRVWPRIQADYYEQKCYLFFIQRLDFHPTWSLLFFRSSISHQGLLEILWLARP
jgi:hypothetical protein